MSTKTAGSKEEEKKGALDKMAEVPGLGWLVRGITTDDEEETNPDTSSEESEVAPVAPIATPVTSQPGSYFQSPNVASMPMTPSVSPAMPRIAGVPDQNMIQKIRESMMGSSASAYSKFMDNFNKLARRGKITDRNVLLQTALDTLDGVSKTQLLQAIEQHVNLLNQEQANFEVEMNDHRQRTIGALEQEDASIDSQVTQIDQQIQELNTKKAELANRKTTLRTELTQANYELETTKNTFNASYQVVLSELTKDQNDISQNVTE